MISQELIDKIKAAFPQTFINSENEAIIHPRNNVYFCLNGCESDEDIIVKLFHWVSRPAHKGETPRVQTYLLDGINAFIGEEFSQYDMARIYNHLGNGIHEQETREFIRSDFNMNLLPDLPEFMKKFYAGGALI